MKPMMMEWLLMEPIEMKYVDFSLCVTYTYIRFALFVVNESAVWSQGQMVRSLWNRKQAWADKVV